MKILVVVDMQKDFTHGALGSDRAMAIVPAVCEKIKNYQKSFPFLRQNGSQILGSEV